MSWGVTPRIAGCTLRRIAVPALADWPGFRRSMTNSGRHPKDRASAMDQRLCFQRQGHVERAPHVDAEEGRRGYADDRHRNAVHEKRFADDAGGAAETPLPEPVADHGDRALRTASGTIVCGRKRTAENRRHAERRKVLGAGEDTFRGLTFTTSRQVESCRRPGDGTVEQRHVRPQILPHRERPPEARGVSARDCGVG